MNREEIANFAKDQCWDSVSDGKYICWSYWTDVFCAKVIKETKARIEAQHVETVYDAEGNKHYFINPRRIEKFALTKNGWMPVGRSDVRVYFSEEPYTYFDPNF